MIIPQNDYIEHTKQNMFFIIGSGRCGTTLLRALLVTHPDIAIPGETHFYNKYRRLNWFKYPLMNHKAYKSLLKEFNSWKNFNSADINWELFQKLAIRLPSSWDSLFISYLTAYRIHSKKAFVGEKTPEHVKYVKYLHQRFPHAKFIHVIRDPRAVVASYLKHNFYKNNFGSNVTVAAQQWVKAAKNHFNILEDSSIKTNQYMMVRYEDLISNPTSTIKSVLYHIDADPEKFDIHKYYGIELNDVSSNHSNIGKEISSNFSQKWKKELNHKQIFMIEKICYPYIEKIGYDLSSNDQLYSSLELNYNKLIGHWLKTKNYCKRILKLL